MAQGELGRGEVESARAACDVLPDAVGPVQGGGMAPNEKHPGAPARGAPSPKASRQGADRGRRQARGDAVGRGPLREGGQGAAVTAEKAAAKEAAKAERAKEKVEKAKEKAEKAKAKAAGEGSG